jgi:uncharacterized protein (TIGR02391 family)
LVEVAGDDPLPMGRFIDERDIAAMITQRLGMDVAFVRSEAFDHSEQRLRLFAVFSELEDQGLLKSRGTMGPQAYAPTGPGRARVRQMREQEEKRLSARTREATDRIFEEIASAGDWTNIDLARLGRAGIALEIAIDALATLMSDGVIERRDKPGLLAKGDFRLTSRGRDRAQSAQRSRSRDDGWREAARLKRELELARLDPISLIRDEELRQRCSDLLAGEAHYDRVLRESCVVLETRIRKSIGAAPTLIGTALVQQAFGNNGPLRLSDIDAEQVGLMNMISGVVAFYRNAAGHRLLTTNREDAIRVVVLIDHLLTLVARACPTPATA